MTTETKLKAALVLSILLTIWMSVMWGNSDKKIFKQNEEIVRQKEEIDNLSSIVDNIFQESFCLNMEVGRYELTLDHLKDINPNAHKKFTYYLNNKIK
jgi:hypothetical protein